MKVFDPAPKHRQIKYIRNIFRFQTLQEYALSLRLIHDIFMGFNDIFLTNDYRQLDRDVRNSVSLHSNSQTGSTDILCILQAIKAYSHTVNNSYLVHLESEICGGNLREHHKFHQIAEFFQR